jgi:hypothetical protein
VSEEGLRSVILLCWASRTPYLNCMVGHTLARANLQEDDVLSTAPGREVRGYNIKSN